MGCYNQNSDTPNSKNGGYHMKHTKKLLSLLLPDPESVVHGICS